MTKYAVAITVSDSAAGTDLDRDRDRTASGQRPHRRIQTVIEALRANAVSEAAQFGHDRFEPVNGRIELSR